jgi:hypothetical protein
VRVERGVMEGGIVGEGWWERWMDCFWEEARMGYGVDGIYSE